ncbi:MAG TPA: ABC transporter permease [Vicinamibacterales bacterium]|nr:ABC transporter permease [Vicinamibacterales bacterium]
MPTIADVKLAVRTLAQAPGRSLLVVLAIAIGIGANAAVFSFVRAVVLQPLPLRHIDRLVTIWESEPARDDLPHEPSYPAFEQWRARAHGFDGMLAMSSVNLAFTWQRRDGPVALRGRVVSDGFFDVLGVHAAIGRTFRPEETTGSPAGRVVVIGHDLWRRAFAADPAVVGTSMSLGGTPFSIVGVMPADFHYPRGAELWTPLVPEYPQLATDADLGWLQVVGRLKPSVSADAAQIEMEQLVRATAREAGHGARLVPLTSEVFGETRGALLLVFGATALVLLAACANVSNILAAWDTSRRRQYEIRLALGATRWMLTRQRLLESALLVFAGGAAGLLAANGALRTLKAAAPPDLVHLDAVHIDRSVLALGIVLFLMTAAMISVVTGMSLPTTAVGLTSAKYGSTPRERRLRRAFVVAQVALAIVVLTAAALLARSYRALKRDGLGFDAGHLLVCSIDLPDGRYRTAEAKRAFFTSALEAIQALPGVDGAAAVYARPLEYGAIGFDAHVWLEGQPLRGAAASNNPLVNWESVTPDYFTTLGVPVLSGRAFTTADRAATMPVVIVGESAAKRLWPRESAVGQRLITQDGPVDTHGDPLWQTVVGVVGDVRYRDVARARLDVYLPYTQTGTALTSIVIRTRNEPLSTLPSLRAIVHRLDPGLPLGDVETMFESVRRMQSPWRFNALLFGTFGALAVLLAGLGMFGALLSIVTEQVRDLAVRAALGAGRRHLIALVMRETMTLTIAGIGAGLVMALLASRALASLLYGVRPLDLASFAAPVVVLVAAGLVGAVIPARQALRADPLEILRL